MRWRNSARHCLITFAGIFRRCLRSRAGDLRRVGLTGSSLWREFAGVWVVRFVVVALADTDIIGCVIAAWRSGGSRRGSGVRNGAGRGNGVRRWFDAAGRAGCRRAGGGALGGGRRVGALAAGPVNNGWWRWSASDSGLKALMAILSVRRISLLRGLPDNAGHRSQPNR
ncbi:hypothetical protein KCP74_13925 [Salmonella enterica subsp. enterica]|nr:hypothetical protein KCP74_13925 [Salmonella enterica subsp. enterica]